MAFRTFSTYICIWFAYCLTWARPVQMQQSSALSTKCTASPLFAFHLLSSVIRRWNPVLVKKKKKHGNEILYIVVNWLKIRFQSSKLKWGEVRLDSTFFMAHLIEKLCFTLIGFLFDNAYMHSVYKSTFFFSYYKATQGCSKMNLSCFFHLGSWCRTLAFYMHFKIWICYSTVWHFERSQPLLVCLISWMSVFLCWRLFFFFFLRGRCQRFESCWVHSAPPINSQEAPVMCSHCRSFFDLIDKCVTL